MSIEVMKQALEALENCVATCFDQYAHEQVMSRPEHFVNQTITALRQTIEQEEQAPICAHGVSKLKCDFCKRPEQAQPVAWMWKDGTITADPDRADGTWTPLYTAPQQPEQAQPVAWMGAHDKTDLYYRKPPQADVIPLYTTPPQRKPLTDEEIAKIASTPCAVVGSYVHTFARAIEAAHGIKETNRG